MRELITQRKNISEVKFAAQDIVDQFIDETLKGDWPFKSDTDIPFIRKFFIQDEIITKATPRQKLDAGQVVSYISTAALDRDHEIMKPSGADLKHYRKNPMVLWSHDPRDPDNIIGKNLWINMDQKGLVALTQFALANEKASKVYNLYRDGFLRAWSVGFTPLKGKKPKPDEKFTFIMGDLPKPGEVVYVHEKWALLEYSAVGVPSNPEALTEQVAKGYELTDELAKELEINLEGLEIGKDNKTIIDLGSILSGESKEEGKEGEEEEDSKEGEENEWTENKEEQLEEFEYLLHHIAVDDNGKEIVHHCYVYDHLANLYEQSHLAVKDGIPYRNGRKIKNGVFHIIKGLEKTQEVARGDEEAKEAGIKPKKMKAGMTLKQKAREW